MRGRGWSFLKFFFANLLQGERALATAIHDLCIILLPPVHQQGERGADRLIKDHQVPYMVLRKRGKPWGLKGLAVGGGGRTAQFEVLIWLRRPRPFGNGS